MTKTILADNSKQSQPVGAHTFEQWWDAGFPEIIPIAPPGGKLSPKSGLVESQLGKIPAEYNRSADDWRGMASWTTRVFDRSHPRAWDRWPGPPNKGLRLGALLALDLDCANPAVAEVRKAAGTELGRTIVRGREGSDRQLMLYRLKAGEPMQHKGRVTFHDPKDPSADLAVEFLGFGGQCVVEGRHTKGGSYHWIGGQDPITFGRGKIPEVTAEQWQSFIATTASILEMMGYEIGKSSLASGGGDRKAIPYDRHLADDPSELIKALACIPNDEDGQQDRGSCVKWLSWFKAGMGASGEDEAREWYLRFSGNNNAGFDVIWNSISDSTGGADGLFAEARQHGYGGVDLPALPEPKKSAVPTELEMAIPVRIDVNGEFVAAREAERRLLAKGVQLYQFNGSVVEIIDIKRRGVRCEETVVTAIRPLSRNALLGIYSEHLGKFERRNLRSNDWETAPTIEAVAKIYLERPSMWRLPTLTGVVNIPTLRPDGSVLSKPGYDAASGLLYIPDGTEVPPIPEEPTKAQAVLALLDIKRELLSGFTFQSDADRAVALSFILSSVARKCFAHAPMHLFSAPYAGSGKGKLVNVASMIATGRHAPATDFSADAEELRKTIEAQLMQGAVMLNFDNVETAIGGRRICSIVTEDTIDARILGKSRTVEVACSLLLSANGINLRIKGNMSRRAVLCYIDPEDPHPEMRTFDFDPVERAKERRGQYVADALTVLVGWSVARRGRKSALPTWGSFGDWSELVRGALVWCGEADPIETVVLVKAEDQEGDALGAVHEAWEKAIGANVPVTVRGLIEKAEPKPGGEFQPLEGEPSPQEQLRDALLSVAEGPPGRIDAKKLGYWLRSVKNTLTSGMLRIIEAKATRTNDRRYQVEKLARAIDKKPA